PLLQGTQLWVKHINERGGLSGHTVTLIVYDDSGDPARHRAQVQEAVERKGVIAFLMNGEAITGQSSVEYITSKRIPVIGTTGGETWVDSSPMYFPQMSWGDDYPEASVYSAAEMTVPKGKTKLGSLV